MQPVTLKLMKVDEEIKEPYTEGCICLSGSLSSYKGLCLDLCEKMRGLNAVNQKADFARLKGRIGNAIAFLLLVVFPLELECFRSPQNAEIIVKRVCRNLYPVFSLQKIPNFGGVATFSLFVCSKRKR